VRKNFARVSLLVPLLGIALGAGLVEWRGAVAPEREREIGALIARSPVTGRPVDDAEELLEALPASIGRNFTLVHASRSPHGGLGDRDAASVDAAFPRVVLFRDDGRLVLALTGNPDRPGYDTVEVVAFDDARAAFRLARYVLPAAVRRDPQLAAARAHNGELDPPECLRCHGQDPRPILDSYPLWPGFYGGVRDTFVDGSAELEHYRAFLSAQRGAPRGLYRHLRWPEGTSVPPYTDPTEYDPAVTEVDEAALRLAPNTRLGMALGELNRKRIARRLAASPRYAAQAPGILAVLLGCTPPPLEAVDREAIARRVQADSAARLGRLGYRPRARGNFGLATSELASPGALAPVLYAAAALGVPASDFSMGLEDGALGFYDGILGREHQGRRFLLSDDVALELLRREAARDPALGRFVLGRRVLGAGRPFGEKLDLERAAAACPTLLERQRASGAELVRPPAGAVAAGLRLEGPGDEALAVEPAVERCTRCHEGDGALQSGRPIPFSSPAALAARLSQPAVGSPRPLLGEILARMRPGASAPMPPHGRAASAEESAGMVRYLTAALGRRGEGR